VSAAGLAHDEPLPVFKEVSFFRLAYWRLLIFRFSSWRYRSLIDVTLLFKGRVVPEHGIVLV
jgi:hypothetical protein